MAEATPLSRFLLAFETCKYPAHVEKLMRLFNGGGSTKVHVIADFDYTLTKYRDGRPTSFDALMTSPYVPAWVQEENKAIAKKYRAIEYAPHMDKEEKSAALAPWYDETLDLIAKSELVRSDVTRAAKESNIIFKDGCAEFLQLLDSKNVPLLIFSAGLGDVVETVVRDKCGALKNTRIIANYLKFDDKIATGYRKETVMPFNKRLTKHREYMEKIESRPYAILLGDSIGDVDMANGIDPKNVLKIGFLNEYNVDRYREYREAFDLVLVNDETLDVATLILKNICLK